MMKQFDLIILPNDNNEYRRLILKNQIKVLIVDDSNAIKSAAALKEGSKLQIKKKPPN